MAVPEGAIHNERLVEASKALDVDILAIQEVDFFQERSLYADQCALVAQGLGAPFFSRGIALHGTPGEKWTKFDGQVTDSAQLTRANGSYYGNGIISRIPIVAEFRIELGR